MLSRDWVRALSAIYCSDEQEAIDGAKILGNHTGLSPQILQDLGENDRSSTGFLEPAESESAADEFLLILTNP